jgi:DNA helicase-2/ATP-dependent DNA helicase PcrA
MLTQYEEIALQVQRQYRSFTVDEFQDVSPVQYELLRAWLGQGDDLCVVGDPTQTIFSFTGASASHLEKFTNDFPNAARFDLTHSYRSTPQIISAANQVSAPLPASVQLKATNPPGPPISVRGFESDDAEALAVAGRIVEVIASGIAPRDIAVLMRMEAQSESIEQALASVGVPYAVRAGTRFFERGEVAVALAALRGAAAAPADVPVAGQVSDVLSGVGWSPTPPTSGPSHRATWESLRVLVDLAASFPQDATLPDFVSHLVTLSETESEPSANAITLATMHSAKGLEWEAVFVVGVSEGLMPVSYARTPDTIDEERRLLYVAMTRARKVLWLSWSTGRGRSSRVASRFLESLK